MEVREDKSDIERLKAETISRWEKAGLLEGLTGVSDEKAKKAENLFGYCPRMIINEPEKAVISHLDLLNNFLIETAEARIGVRRKIVIIEKFIKKFKMIKP